jgi:hypothetical protein
MEAHKMDSDELNLQTCRATWREDARNLATCEAQDNGLQGEKAEAYIQQREQEIYLERERIGQENIEDL